MDPQKLSQLDPKLREAYQRVMGTSTPQPAPAQNQTPPPPPNLTPNIHEPPATPIGETPFNPMPQQPQTNPMAQQNPQQNPSAQQPNNFVQMNSEVVKSQAPAQAMVLKKKNRVMPVFIVAAAIVFLVIYTLFWTKIFNLKLPFLP